MTNKRNKNHTHSFTHNDVEILERSIVYDGFFKMIKFKFRFRLYQGGWSDVIEREVFERNESVAVLPVDLITEELLLLEQVRVGVLNTKKESPWLLELVAGMVENSETPKEVASREAKEEAGLELDELIYINDYWSSPGGSTEKITLYCGLINAQNVLINKFYGLQEEAENIKVYKLKFTEAFDLLAENKIKNAHTIIALQWLNINVKNLKEKILNK